ncbi:haloacid dehalogenase type II [Kiloniella sp. b19]|uniref:haloacid dehalogenase type II n=1 Tax=Kiloniella sp. GXU_MW_B19 TaxID=3141326 RepID=UPI0031CE54DF
MSAKPDKPKVIFFDVNETLLDLTPLKASVGAALGDRPDLLPLWFTTLLQYSLVDTLCEDYSGFDEIGVAVLCMLAQKQGLSLSLQEARSAVQEPFRRLPPHPDVLPSLQRLKAAGVRITCLANSPAEVLADQFDFAGMSAFFERRISTEEAGAFKPDARTYAHGLSVVGEQPGDVMMVASHAWDLKGAARAGLRTAFLQRPGAMLYPLASEPDIVVPDLAALTDHLLGA